MPVLSVFTGYIVKSGQSITFTLIGKWFIFYAVGFRLFIAGLTEVTYPLFTAKDIFHIEDKTRHDIVKELGFANLCFSLTVIILLFLPGRRIISAFVSGLYYALARLNHFIKKPVSLNETFASVTSIFVFAVLLIYMLLIF